MPWNKAVTVGCIMVAALAVACLLTAETATTSLSSAPTSAPGLPLPQPPPPWAAVDVSPFDALARAITRKSVHDGTEKLQIMLHYATMNSHVTTVCVVGFNDGLSVAVLLRAYPQAKVHVIGLGDEYSSDAEVFLWNATETSQHGLHDVPSRFHLHRTPAAVAVRDFGVAHSTDKCGLVVVHGDGGVNQTVRDIKFMAYATADPSVLLVDGTQCDDVRCVDAAVTEHVRRGTVQRLGATRPRAHTRGMTALRFDVSPLYFADALGPVTRGSWHAVELEPFTKLGAALSDQVLTEGHSAELIAERQLYVKLAQMPNVKRICEIGFNSGHSAGLWLMANPTAEVIMFDLWEHAYAKDAEAKLRDKSFTNRFGLKDTDQRLRIVKGSSLKTVPQFATQNPTVKCDLISVDGGHTYEIATADIKNMHSLANPNGNLLVVDDSNCDSWWCVDTAIEEHQRRGSVKSLFGVAEYRRDGGYDRGVTVLQYTLPIPPPEDEEASADDGAATRAAFVAVLIGTAAALFVGRCRRRGVLADRW